jgi:GAF domain-containing protein
MMTPTQNRYMSENVSQDAWRERFLQRILVLSAIVGLFALIPAVISTSDLILQSVYIVAYVFLVSVIVIRLPYMVKATIFVLLPLVLGFGSLTETGIRGDSLFFFLAFVTFSSLLIGPRAGVASIITTEIIIIGMGYLILNDYFTLSEKLAFKGDFSDWASAAASQLLISLVVMFALRMLNESFRETQQHAIALHESQLISQKDLEGLIAERTQELSRKTNLLNSTFIVAHQTATLQDLDRLLNRTVSLISEHFACYHVGLYLVNQRGDYVTLQATSSEGGKKLLEQGYRLRVGTEGIIGHVAADKKPRISLDVDKDIIFFANPELAETRSEMALPLIAHNKVVGVLDLQSSEAHAFKYDEIEIFQTMADQIAVAIENARLLNESQLVISQLEILSSENTRQNWKSEVTTHTPSFHYSVAGVHPINKFASQKGKNVLDIPLVLHGQKIGNISLQRKVEFQKWTAQEEAIAREVATQTALALENIRLIESTRERANREQVISNISAKVRETLDLDVVLRTSAREIQRALNLQEAEIRLLPQDGLGDLGDEENLIDETSS